MCEMGPLYTFEVFHLTLYPRHACAEINHMVTKEANKKWQL